MKMFLTVIQIIFATALIALIILQNGKGGLGNAFGGGEMYRTKRGAERIVFISTIVIAALFLITSLLSVSIQ